MPDEWRPLPEFPRYEMHRSGQVRDMDCGYVARNHMYNGTTYVHIYVGTTMYIRKYCELMQEVFPKGEQS